MNQPQRTLPAWQAHGFALVLTTVLLLLRLALGFVPGQPPVLILFTIPIMISAYLGGLWPGLTATMLATLVANFFLLPRYGSSSFATPLDVLQTGGLLAAGTLISVLIEALHRTRRQAQSSQQLQALTLASLSDAILTTDTHGRVTFINAEAERLTGWTPGAAIGQPLDAVFQCAEQDARTLVDEFAAKLMDKHELASHTLLRCRDGSVTAISQRRISIHSAGDVAGTVLVFHATAEREQAATARLLLAEIVESSSDAIIGKNLQGIVTSWNNGATHIFGYTASEMLGQPITRLIPPDRLDEESTILASIARGQRIGHFETVRRHKNGALLDIAVTVSPIRTAEGQIIGASKIARDISARKRAEAQLREHEQKLAAIFELLPVGISILNAERKILYTNPALTSILNVSSSDLAANTYGAQAYLNAAGEPMTPDDFASVQALRNQRPAFNVETGIVQHDGRVTWTDVSAVPVDFPDWKLVIVSSDITRRKQAEQASRESEERLRIVTEAAQVGMVIVDQQHCYRYANQAYATIFGLPSADIVGQRVADVLAPVYESQIRPRLERAFQGVPVHYELVLSPRAPDMRERFYTVHYEPGIYRSNMVVIVTVVEISQHKHAEVLLREQADLLDQVSDAIISVDTHFAIKSWNAAAEALYGWPAQDVIGKPMHEIVPTEYLDSSANQSLALLMAQGHWRGEVIQPHRDGTRLTILSSVRQIIDPTGNRVGVVGINHDITDRKQAEQALAHTNQRLRVLSDASRVFAEAGRNYPALLDQVALTIGQQLESACIVRLISDDAQWFNVAAMYHPNPALREYWLAALSRLSAQAGAQNPAAQAARTKQAILLPAAALEAMRQVSPELDAAFERFQPRSALVAPLHSHDQVIGSLMIMRFGETQLTFSEDDRALAQDLAERAALALENARLFEQAHRELAERQRAEAALEAERATLARRVQERTADLSIANAELARAARLKDEFLASMSHELRTPLNSILGRSEALQEEIYGALFPKQIDALRGIEASGRHLLALINDILDLSKIEADKLELLIEPVVLDLLCRSALQMVAQTARQKRISLTSTLDSSAESLPADERRLRQILVNLLSNAVKFTPEGGKVGLEVHGDAERGALTFTVWDTGIGIAENDQQRLFKPFVQIDSRLNRQYEGTGLGLALVLRLAQAHGGSVALESTPGQGSRFSVTLPWKPEQHASLREPGTIPATQANAAAIQRALLIEDSPSTAEQIGRYLNDLGVQVEVHTQADGAFERAIALRPGIIVLDILLPDDMGWEILRQLKTEPRTRAIPVLVVTAIDEPERARALGAAGFLLKPVERARFTQMVQRLATAPIHSAFLVAPEQLGAPLRHILLAEDNQATIELLQDYLHAKGYAVVVARNGGEALLRAQEATPALILMDIQMPGMDGLEAIRRIRADAALQHIPIIALTALAMPGDRERCLAAGASDYLAKPVNLRVLLAAIQERIHHPPTG